jgi:DNA-binding winged helix-turn-helix (wHTH) protein
MARLTFQRFCFDSDQKALLRGGEPVRLTPRAFRLLEILLRQRPKAVSKRDLLDYVWAGTIVEEANLKTLVLEIRSAIENRGGTGDVIRTVFGYGYAFAAPVEEEADRDAEGQMPAVISVRWLGRSVLLPGGTHLIGRRADCSILIDAPSVSRVHARLEVSQRGQTIEDLRSKNGTFVGDRRIEASTELFDRCEIRIGEVPVEIARLDAGEASTLTLG